MSRPSLPSNGLRADDVGMTRPLLRWTTRAAVLTTSVACLTVVVPPSPASAATLDGLYAVVRAAAYDYNASATTWHTFVTADRTRWSAATVSGGARLFTLRGRLHLADTQSKIDALVPLVTTERTRARVFRRATSLAAVSGASRRAAVKAGQDGFTALLAGTLDQAGWAEVRSDSAAVAALAAVDRRHAWSALGSTISPAASVSYPARPALTSTARATAPAGWTAVPGGCAVPTATSSWVGAATQPGRHLWVDEQQVTAASARLASGDPRALQADSNLRRLADKLKTPLTTDLTAVASPLQVRSQRLGYSSLLGDTAATAWLGNDLGSALLPGPKAGNSLRDAVSLEALATDLDWLGLDESSSAEARRLQEAMLVRWLGPLSCRYDDLESTVTDSGNIALVVGAATLMGSLAIAPQEPVLAASLARASLQRLLPGVTAMTVDGGSVEGPSYWNLQGRYLAAVYGTVHATWGDAPPVALPDPSQQAAWAFNSTTSTGVSLPFADSLVRPDPLRPGLVAWVAHTSSDARAGALVRNWLMAPGEGFQALWWPTDAALAAATPTRTSALFPHTGVAVLQAGPTTAWLKGGSARDTHTHLDRGSVGFSKYGVQWAVDPGQGDYAAPEYNSSGPLSLRWTYWKVSAAGHTTLHPPGGQPPRSTTPFSDFTAGGEVAPATAGAGSATLDLSSALPGSAEATRQAALSTDGILTVSDHVTSVVAQPWTWSWVTDASVSLTDNGSDVAATLTRDGKTVHLVVSGLPSGSTAAVVDAPSGAVGPDGRALRVIELSLGASFAFDMTTQVS